jgi:single-stranded DNA-binding protein
MNSVFITVTGLLGDDPRTFTLGDGTAGVELRLAVEVPGRGSGNGMTRWMKIKAYGVLASRTAESVRKGDRVIVTADDVVSEAWLTKAVAPAKPEPRSGLVLVARDIAASMTRDSLRTGYAARKAQRLAAANGEPSDLPAHEQAEARVLSGVTTDPS